MSKRKRYPESDGRRVARKIDDFKYHDFKRPSECWNQSDAHIKEFIHERDCPRKGQYHHYECYNFDSFIESFHGKEHRRDLFEFYFPNTVHVGQHLYMHRMTDDPRELRELAGIEIKLYSLGSLRERKREIPPKYKDFAEFFKITIGEVTTKQNQRSLIYMIERCIRARWIFRERCVRDCSARLNPKSHDDFILILSILRARIKLLKLS